MDNYRILSGILMGFVTTPQLKKEITDLPFRQMSAISTLLPFLQNLITWSDTSYSYQVSEWPQRCYCDAL
jgi:hypothetical protein